MASARRLAGRPTSSGVSRRASDRSTGRAPSRSAATANRRPPVSPERPRRHPGRHQLSGDRVTASSDNPTGGDSGQGGRRRRQQQVGELPPHRGTNLTFPRGHDGQALRRSLGQRRAGLGERRAGAGLARLVAAGFERRHTWTTLDTKTGQNFDQRFETRAFDSRNTTAYTVYRLNITALYAGPAPARELRLADGSSAQPTAGRWSPRSATGRAVRPPRRAGVGFIGWLIHLPLSPILTTPRCGLPTACLARMTRIVAVGGNGVLADSTRCAAGLVRYSAQSGRRGWTIVME